MGMAVYYLKAEDCDEKTLDDINAFIREGQASHNFWQDNRSFDDEKREGFWNEFKKRFPTVYEMLQMEGLADGDFNNSLAGKLSFGDTEEAVRNDYGDLMFDAEVWHFADWDILSKFLEQKFGVKKARWVSDEYISIYDYL